MWKKLGRILAKPVTVPANLVKKGVRHTMIGTIAKLAARHLLTFIGGAGVAASDSEIGQVASALATIVGIVWSVIEKRRAAPKAEASTP